MREERWEKIVARFSPISLLSLTKILTLPASRTNRATGQGLLPNRQQYALMGVDFLPSFVVSGMAGVCGVVSLV
jgi:hypothetical protein